MTPSYSTSVNIPEQQGPDGNISVCIAAYNEVTTIGHLLQKLAGSAACGVDEIIVCVNGCYDGTEDVVRRHRQGDSRVHLIESPKGKPAAWNALMHRAKNDVRLFLDADVDLADGFFEAIHGALRNHPQALVVAARDLPKRRAGGIDRFITSIASRAMGFDYVCGRAYALRNEAIKRHLNHPDSDKIARHLKMPLDVLHEDLWLEVFVGRSLITFATNARVYYDPGTVQDLLKTRVRLNHARMQIAEMLPSEFKRWQADSYRTRRPIDRMKHRLSTVDGIGDAMACVIGSIARRAIMRLFRNKVRQLQTTMHEQMLRHGGSNVLAGSGRLSK
jgi:glycosyltransferase involved in cell wall biosynthesis